MTPGKPLSEHVWSYHGCHKCRDEVVALEERNEALEKGLRDIAEGNKVPDEMLNLDPVEFQRAFVTHLQTLARSLLSTHQGGAS